MIRAIIAILWGLFFCLDPVFAHEIRPAIADVDLSDQKVRVEIVVNAEALLAGIGPQHKDTKDAPQAERYDALRNGPPYDVEKSMQEFLPRLINGIELMADGERIALAGQAIRTEPNDDTARARRTHVTLTGRLPRKVKTVTWRYEAKFGSSVVKFRGLDDSDLQSQWLPDGKRSTPFYLHGQVNKPDRLDVITQYLVLGFTHIVPKGLDHILFVLGLFFLSTSWRPLLWQITAFTLAHSITLGLSIYGIVSLSPSIVEPLIALSIVYVGVENLCTQRLLPWRVFVVFGFGLLHGLGFAGVLTEIGLPRSEFLTALIAFNIGVEFGQLVVLLIAFAIVGYWGWHSANYRNRVVMPASIIIAAVGLHWAIDRF